MLSKHLSKEKSVQIKVGTLWWAGDTKKFRVLSVTTIDGHDWVHYREDLGLKTPANECKEYSCYLESFVERFRQCPE
jgi:hypothetical protein